MNRLRVLLLTALVPLMMMSFQCGEHQPPPPPQTAAPAVAGVPVFTIKAGNYFLTANGATNATLALTTDTAGTFYHWRFEIADFTKPWLTKIAIRTDSVTLRYLSHNGAALQLITAADTSCEWALQWHAPSTAYFLTPDFKYSASYDTTIIPPALAVAPPAQGSSTWSIASGGILTTGNPDKK